MIDVREVERYVVQTALSQGWISREMLERAARFRSKQTERGRGTTLLKVLRPFVSAERYRLLEQTWQLACRYAAQSGSHTATDIQTAVDAGQGRAPQAPRAPGHPRDTAIDALAAGDGVIDLG